MTTTWIYLPTFQHENLEQILEKLLEDTNYNSTEKKYKVIAKPNDLEAAKNILIMTDDISRFGDSPEKVIKTILGLLDRENVVMIPNQIDLDYTDKRLEAISLLELLNSVKRKVKSSRIRQSLYVKAQLKGKIHDTSKVTPEIKKQIVQTYNRLGGIRKTARELGVSPATVARVIRIYKESME